MFGSKYFGPRFFAPRYWGPSAAVPITSSGIDRIIRRAPSSTSWNKDWAKQYGPDYERALAAKEHEVEEALETLAAADEGIDELVPAQQIAARSLASELMSNEADRHLVMATYYEYIRWKTQMEEERRRRMDAIVLLLLT